jgi:phage tail-like protein
VISLDWYKTIGPLGVFNFDVVFIEVDTAGAPIGEKMELCRAAFSEITGLEATMEPKVIKEGGRNFGVVQRVGPTTFGTVVLKRGISNMKDLWMWFELVAGGSYAKRMTATITLYGPEEGPRDQPTRTPIYQWRLLRALPTKFKTADFNASSTSVGIEELHLAHEGMERA